ncbi:hypothetical protein E8L90_09430 [Brevibacillus antibioticus]|uniref:Uncharacterized protein n=1 Tax=Brevibacillus antibioticus TaxID=2570228 RepID=A0A4U2Y557_9BACL|nr:hypothetical protein [Brevibacillus antibioticus]TKI55648.1 hypothetical protein E8L90_09430 [Brevibacillus antibioticus]
MKYHYNIQEENNQIQKSEENVNLDIAYMEALCNRYGKDFDFISSTRLSSKHLKLIDKYYGIADGESILAFYSNRYIFNRAKEEILLSSKGIYWRSGQMNLDPSYLTWSQYAQATSAVDEVCYIQFRPDHIFQSRRSNILTEVLEDFYVYMASLLVTNNPIMYHYDQSYNHIGRIPTVRTYHDKWMLVENGMPLYPLRNNDIHWVIEMGQVDTAKLQVWKLGMSEWVYVEEVAELMKKG